MSHDELEGLESDGAPLASFQSSRKGQPQRCSYCDEYGHRVTTCPERRKVARAERLLHIEERAKVLRAADTIR